MLNRVRNKIKRHVYVGHLTTLQGEAVSGILTALVERLDEHIYAIAKEVVADALWSPVPTCTCHHVGGVRIEADSNCPIHGKPDPEPLKVGDRVVLTATVDSIERNGTACVKMGSGLTAQILRVDGRYLTKLED